MIDEIESKLKFRWMYFFAECQVENNRITELLEEIQILKEELQSKDQEIEHSQNFVEKYKKLRQKVSTIQKGAPIRRMMSIS